MKKTFDARVDDLLRALGLLMRRVRAAGSSHELSLTEYAVLKHLANHGPATTADLARAERVKPQSMGAAIAVLADENLVERRPHPTDGRQMLIRVTKRGSALCENAQAARHGWLAQAVAQLDSEEQSVLWRAAEIIRRVAEQ